MNIVMLTNTYIPHVGGVARSVESFAHELRHLGQRVLVVAPTFDETPEDESGVVRVPAVQNFNGSDFSVRLPIPGLLSSALDDFEPDLIHAHHPFLLGDTALRIASHRSLPLVFTHHTMYERYTHYVPGDSDLMKRYAIRLATEYANLCDHVVAPSESIADILRDRGVTAPLTAIPTGIDQERFSRGDGQRVRHEQGMGGASLVVGHVGRLAAEKNLSFLASAVAAFLESNEKAHWLVVGGGPSRSEIESRLEHRGVRDRVHLTGSLDGQQLVDAYHAMDIFVFASQTETQGMVLAEAMAAGVPVIAVDAPGTREVVIDGENGVLLQDEDAGAFVRSLEAVADADADRRRAWSRHARRTAAGFSLERCSERLSRVYEQAGRRPSRPSTDRDESTWTEMRRLLETEWGLWTSRAEAAVRSIRQAGSSGESDEQP